MVTSEGAAARENERADKPCSREKRQTAEKPKRAKSRSGGICRRQKIICCRLGRHQMRNDGAHDRELAVLLTAWRANRIVVNLREVQSYRCNQGFVFCSSNCGKGASFPAIGMIPREVLRFNDHGLTLFVVSRFFGFSYAISSASIEIDDGKLRSIYQIATFVMKMGDLSLGPLWKTRPDFTKP